MTDILALARKVAGAAAAGEQVEAYAGQGTSTSVKVHGGEVESLTQATSAGIGVRVVRDGRQGFAWAGSLDDGVVAEVLAEARDNAAFAGPDEWVGLAEPDGVAAPDFDLWRDSLAELPTERKIELALELEAAVKAGDPRVVGVRTSQWGDGYGEGAVATSTGLEAWGRSTANPVQGWYGIKKGLRGRFAMYVPPVLEALGLVELEHNAKNNRVRAR